jgi:serine phosphatase RsbU (regulator of sigma subunit)/anti-anti-sigma regulatory factor
MTASPPAPAALVVEDEPVTRRLVVKALQDFGCRSVLEARDGLEAKAVLRERADIDLVVTDILMPGLDGMELLRWGREELPNTAWIILSGLDTFDSAVEAIRLGAFDFLAKPPRVAELEVAARNALERRALVLERERLYEELRAANAELVERLGDLEEKSERLRRDLERAEVIQRALLPSAPPPLDRYCVNTLYRPGQHVGGDLYDVVPIGEGHVALYVADATGHGVTAAMLSVLFKHHLVFRDQQTGLPLGPAAVLEAVNRALTDALVAPGLFLTAVYALLDTGAAEVTLASAGHPPVLHVPATGESRSIGRTGPALGLGANARFGEARFRLEPRDRLLFYTDGLTQPGGVPGAELLPDLLRRHPESGEAALSALLTRALGDLEAEDCDDITLLLLDVREGASGFDNGTAGAAPSGSKPPARQGVAFQGESGETSYLVLRGRVTWIHCTAFFEAARVLLEAGRRVVVDLSRCEYLDSTCLGTVHQLVERPGVRLRNVPDSVKVLFEELGMEQVLAASHEESGSLPELRPLVTAPVGEDEGRRRIREAHEALAGLSRRNRETFAGVLRSLDDAGETD